MENFVLYDEIGSGNQRTVYKGRRKGTIEYVAIHCIDKSKRKQIQNNVRICHELDHHNVVVFKEWYETSNHLWLVVELCTGESLRTILLQDSYLPEATVKTFGIDIVMGLHYLHSLEIIYADLIPSKILLDGNGVLKFSNFSLARIVGEQNIFSPENNESVSSSSENKILGSPVYVAPEVLCGDFPSKCSDMWSLGCILYELFTGTPPFKNVSFDNLCEQIMEAKTPYPMQGQDGTFTKASENLYMLIQGLLQKDPLQRIDWLELCLHPFWDGELSHLADDNMKLRSISSNDSRCTSIMSNYNVLESRSEVTHEEHHDPIQNEQSSFVDNQQPQSEFKSNKVNQRPETVPKSHFSHKLQTSSLHIPEEKSFVNNSVQSERSSSKIAWQGTYKLERGLAVMDLTEVSDSENESQLANPSYSKSRESKKSHVGQSKSDIDLDASVNSANMLGLSEMIPTLGGLDLNVIDHLYHATDLIVMPIAENNKLRKLPALKWENNILGFLPFSIDKLQNSRREDLKGHIVQIFNTFSQVKKSAPQEKTGLRQKMSILAYLNTVVKVEEVSNLILEENLLKSLLNELKVSGLLDLKSRIGRVLGVVASCTTYISPQFNMSEVFSVATDQIKQNFRSTQIKQSFLPVIGEFLFYAATQEESEDRELQSWEPTGAVFTMINKCLQQADDYITRHIAAKIIENITSTTGRYCKKFLTNDVGLGLWNLFVHASSDMEKLTAASALCRISMHSTTVVQHVSDRAGLTAFQSGLITGTQKSQQAFVTIFVSLLSNPIHAKRILQDHNLIKKILQTIDSSTTVLRGKIYLLIAEMSIRSHDVLLLCCEGRLITNIERDSKKIFMSGKENKETLEYIHQCLTVVVNCVVSALPRIIDGVLHILDIVSGRHHPNPAQVKQLKLHLPLLQILLHVITSSMFRKRIMNATFIQSIGKLLMQIKKIDSGEINLSSNTTRAIAENITTTIFSIIEAIAQHPPLLLGNETHIIEDVLPVLICFGKSEDGNLRMLSWKLFSDISTIYLDNENSTRRNDEQAEDRLFKVIDENFIPQFDMLLQDQHPLPAYCLKLLYACTEKYPNIIQSLLDRNVISTLLSILRSYQSDVNSSILQSTVGILNNIVSNKDIDFMSLCKRGLIEYISSAFIEVASSIEENVNTSSVSPLLLQLLDTLHHVLKNIELAVKNVLSSKSETIASKHDVEDLLQESNVLSELNGILINLLVYDDSDIQKWSCRCLYLSAELFGGTYQECFADDNLECICQFIKVSPRKQQKIMLRILKRLISSNENLRDILNHAMLNRVLVDLKDNDDISVKNLSMELLKMINFA